MFKRVFTKTLLHASLFTLSLLIFWGCRFLEVDRYRENIIVFKSTSDEISRKDEILFKGKVYCQKKHLDFEKLKVKITKGSRLVVSKNVSLDGQFKYSHILSTTDKGIIDFQISFHYSDSEIYMDFLRFTKINDENTFEFKFNYCEN